jgi:hypothetical protein
MMDDEEGLKINKPALESYASMSIGVIPRLAKYCLYLLEKLERTNNVNKEKAI